MVFLFLILAGAIIFYIRYFILNSLKNKQQRIQTFNAALKAVYFIPVFHQAFFMFCTALIYFFSVCKGFFLLLQSLSYLRPGIELQFLYIAAFICIAALVLCSLFILAKISMNKKWDGRQLLFKIAYLLFSIAAEILIYFNLPLFYPPMEAYNDMPFYGNAFVILLAVMAYIIILVLPFIYTVQNKVLQYFQLAVRVSLLYVVISFVLAAAGLIIFLAVKLIA